MTNLTASSKFCGTKLSLGLFVVLTLALPVHAGREPAADAGGKPGTAVAEGREREGVRPKSKDPFAAGQWTIYGYGSGAAGKSARKVYAGHVGLGYYFLDNVSLNLETAGYFIEQSNDTGGAGLNLASRWHYWRGTEWSLYFDGGAGLMHTRDTLRDPGTHFNFTLQGGMGVTYDLTERLMPMTGLRWFHISNARIQGKDHNVGFDSPMFYIGLILPFKLR